MSFDGMRWALEKGQAYELDQATRHVMLLLGNHANSETGAIFPGLGLLEDETGLSERQIRRCIKKLLAVGLLEYGDQSVVSHFRRDRRPKVYQFTWDRFVQRPDVSTVGQMPKKKRPWSRKPKPPSVPVDKPKPAPRRPDTESLTAGQTGGPSVHQSFNPLKDNPAAHAGAAPPEVDHGAVYRLRAAARERLARKGMVFADHLFAPMPM